MSSSHPLPEALLILGSPGSGKTPLGRICEAKGLWGRRCLHFDFGEELRAVAGGGGKADLDSAELSLVRSVLEKGALLEDRHFGVAEKILRRFLEDGRFETGDLVLLNGLPRHEGQARRISGILAVPQVLCLECEAGVAQERISRDTGGDRSGRRDDAIPDVERRLALFRERTAPLVGYYKESGARIIRIAVDARMGAEVMRKALEKERNPK